MAYRFFHFLLLVCLGFLSVLAMSQLAGRGDQSTPSLYRTTDFGHHQAGPIAGAQLDGLVQPAPVTTDIYGSQDAQTAVGGPPQPTASRRGIVRLIGSHTGASVWFRRGAGTAVVAMLFSTLVTLYLAHLCYQSRRKEDRDLWRNSRRLSETISLNCRIPVENADDEQKSPPKPRSATQRTDDKIAARTTLRGRWREIQTPVKVMAVVIMVLVMALVLYLSLDITSHTGSTHIPFHPGNKIYDWFSLDIKEQLKHKIDRWFNQCTGRWFDKRVPYNSSFNNPTLKDYIKFIDRNYGYSLRTVDDFGNTVLDTNLYQRLSRYLNEMVLNDPTVPVPWIEESKTFIFED